ncbi:A kinase (PRKA) anchor protein 1b [Salmo salar]|uniref:A kinase (PRKA) anchor protein 1b n=1 Tax=Salmo salar TaxID=8030 RepID=A0A1S3T1J1_SALSA|nr:A kinase (PRKA) anchor protein 1b [Salmo salar]|eukprot:XP_014070465.1 PREDICTED: A-kinase anchor protein 1, mitochondrial-like isoform X1 [Salmo salar]
MPLRFRSIVPYTLPGVLALIGWWWYISRKKERITNHDSEAGAATMGLLASPAPSDGSNGLVEKGTVSLCATATTPTTSSSCRERTASSRVRPSKTKEQRSTEQEVVAQIHIPAIKAQAVEVQSTSCSPTERASHHPDRANAVTDPGVDRCQQTPRSSSSPAASTLPTQTRKESWALQGERGATGQRPPAAIAYVTKPVKSTVTEQVPASVKKAIATASEALVLSQTAHATASSSTAADLMNAERPEPEGEVAAAHEAAVAFTQNLQVELVAKDALLVPSSSTKNELPSSSFVPAETPAQALKVVTHEPLFPETPTSSQGSYHAVVTSTSAFPAQGPQQENGPPCSSEELEDLAAGLITEVIWAATQEVLSVTSCPETWLGQSAAEPCCRSTPLANGRPCSEQEPLTRNMDEGPSPISHAETEWRAQQKEGMPNGCPPAPAWEPMGTANALSNPWAAAAAASSQEGRREVSSVPVNLDKLKGNEGVVVEDSACSMCHSEDGVSSEDQQSRESQEDLIQVSGMSEGEGGLRQAPEEVVTKEQVMAALPGHVLGAVGDVKRLNGMALRNGSHGMSETETDQSGGSDVNSMDSVDSGCTMGARDSSGSPAMALGSELIVWEIEVPKHLVGRLIGKQGRYVSFLKQSSGAKIYISTLPYTQEFQICHIEGSQQQVDKALSLIGKKFKDLNLTNLYAPPPLPLTLPSLPMTSWLLLPSGVTVEVIVVNIVSAGHLFVQQHTHPTYHALRSLDQQMFLCYSQPETPTLPSPAEVGVICAAPAVEGAWWRAQVISFYKETSEVEIRYVDYGGYDRVKIDTLRQIRSDFVTLPFQGAEVLLDNIAPLPGENSFSTEATSALEEITRGVALLAQVTNYDNNTGLPLVQMWNMVGEELVSVNRTLAERVLGTWVDSF